MYTEQIEALRFRLAKYGEVKQVECFGGKLVVEIGKGFINTVVNTVEIGNLINQLTDNEFPVIDKMRTDKDTFVLHVKHKSA